LETFKIAAEGEISMFYVGLLCGHSVICWYDTAQQRVLMVISASYCQDVAEMNQRTPEVVRPAWKPFVCGLEPRTKNGKCGV
jgi:hypothetical protein